MSWIQVPMIQEGPGIHRGVAMAEHSHSTRLVLRSVPDGSSSYATAEVGVLMCY